MRRRPHPASSGRPHRHRLNRGGDRHANNALWRIALVRMRCHPPTRAYVERRTKQGLSKLDILRCLKRYIAREVYHHLTDPPAITPPATFSATIAEQHREELLSQADQARLAHDRRPKNRRWQWRAPRWERSATRPAKA